MMELCRTSVSFIPKMPVLIDQCVSNLCFGFSDNKFFLIIIKNLWHAINVLFLNSFPRSKLVYISKYSFDNSKLFNWNTVLRARDVWIHKHCGFYW